MSDADKRQELEALQAEFRALQSDPSHSELNVAETLRLKSSVDDLTQQAAQQQDVVAKLEAQVAERRREVAARLAHDDNRTDTDARSMLGAAAVALAFGVPLYAVAAADLSPQSALVLGISAYAASVGHSLWRLLRPARR